MTTCGNVVAGEIRGRVHIVACRSHVQKLLSVASKTMECRIIIQSEKNKKHLASCALLA